MDFTGPIKLHPLKKLPVFISEIFPILLLSLATVCQADEKGVVGVWTGTIGSASVTACFNRNVHSYYYYHKHLVPIGLEPGNTSTTGGSAMRWTEPDGNWVLNTVSHEEITGEWISNRQGKFPITLKRVAIKNTGKKSDPGNTACGSDEFFLPLERNQKMTIGETKEIRNLRYRYKSLYLATASYGMRDGHPATLIERGGSTNYQVSAVEFIGNDPATQTLNKVIKEIIPRDQDLIGQMFDVRREFTAHGMESSGTYRYNVGLSFLNQWLTLVVSEASSSTISPISISERKYLFDMTTGKRLNPLVWFKGGEKMELSNPTNLPSPLAEFVFSQIDKGDPRHHLGRDMFNECYNSPTAETVAYNLDLTKNAMRFDVPTNNNGSCGDSFEIPFSQLAPYLNDAGRAALSRIK